ncbi:MAG: polyphenol oxidase family protein [Eubacteriales bacterium]
MFEKREKNGIPYYVSPILEQADFAHMFCTRHGGVSGGDFASLNVSTARKDRAGCTDSPLSVGENYRRALAILSAAPAQACGAHQVHGAQVREVTLRDGGRGVVPEKEPMPDADGLLLRAGTANVRAVCVKTADCVPILLANRRTGDVCAVHAGWRGSAADIVTEAVRALVGTANGSGTADEVYAAIGPCIGACCYEVGDEVYAAFAGLFRSKRCDFDVDALFPVFPSCSLGGRRHLDLAAVNRALLLLCGVPERNIDTSGMCTCCFAADGTAPFFSHRASGGCSGTFLSAVRVRE